jgi:ribosomal protein S18 acetylase RimI-like enzyme
LPTDVDRLPRSDATARAHATATLARAFFDYALMVYAVPEAARRGRAVRALYAALLADGLRYGEVYATGDRAGIACWLPPGREHLTLFRQLRAGMLSVPLRFGAAGFRRLLAYDTLGRALHHELAPMPHWYLSAIGVAPERQGQGVAAALLQPILQRADAAGLPCYLETHREANLRIYQKHGFDLVRRADPPGHAVPAWSMLRMPR